MSSIREDSQGRTVYEYQPIVSVASTDKAVSGQERPRVRRTATVSEGMESLKPGADLGRAGDALKQMSMDLLSKICDSYQCPETGDKSELARFAATQMFDALVQD